MKIFRIELENGDGPFRYSDYEIGVYNLFESLENKGQKGSRKSPNRHPGPSDDLLLSKIVCNNYYYFKDIYKNYKFGFETKDQFFRWFDYRPLRIAMRSNNYLLSTYECNDSKVVIGSHQIMYDPKYAKIINRVPVPINNIKGK